MLRKALLHKQMTEIKNMYFQNRKKGQPVNANAGPGMKILFGFLYLIMLGAFFALAALFGTEMFKLDLAWVYFMIMTIMAFAVGILGSVFTTSAALFKAKDNEFLLAMPILPSQILFCRMISVFVMSFIYESMVMLPAIVYYFIAGRPTALAGIFCILGWFLMAFMVTGFSCLFGWLIALVSSKLKNQKILTVIVSVIVIAAVILLRFKANDIFKELATNGARIGESVQGWGYPLYALGLGMSGHIVGFLVFLLMTAVVFGLTYLIMSKSFFKVVSTKNESVKSNFKASQIKTAKVKSALRRKEMKRFTSSPTYMINCGLGVLFILIGTVFLIIKSRDISIIISAFGKADSMLRMVSVFGAAIIWILVSFCDIAAPSISLEGNRVWQLKVMPINMYDVLMAKLYVHVVITGIPTLIGSVVMGIVLHLPPFAFIMLVVSSLAFVIFSGSAMLAIDLKRPMLDWNNETQPIKQNVTIIISMFGGLILAAILGGLYILFGRFVDGSVYLLVCTVLFVGVSLLLNRWFKNKGRERFESLGQTF